MAKTKPLVIAENQDALSFMQKNLKVPKDQYNAFGKYKYRKAEDILEAAKSIMPEWFSLICKDEVVQVWERIYVKSTAILSNWTKTYSTAAYAREDNEQKWMAWAQITGSSSSYARKYALNWLFAIDDTADADQTNTHWKDEAKEESKEEAKPAQKKEWVAWKITEEQKNIIKEYKKVNNISNDDLLAQVQKVSKYVKSLNDINNMPIMYAAKFITTYIKPTVNENTVSSILLSLK